MATALPFSVLSFYIGLKQRGLYRIVQYKPRIDANCYANDVILFTT